jgi:DNA-binding transcriptional ArsR family regulator
MSPSNIDVPRDPNLFRLPAVQERTRLGRGASSARGEFIKGPIDVAWVRQAAQLGVTALLVGLALWYVKGLRRTDSFIISNLMVAEWGIQPDAKSRALRKLEKAGLVSIERRGKRSPLVSLVVNVNVAADTPPELLQPLQERPGTGRNPERR